MRRRFAVIVPALVLLALQVVLQSGAGAAGASSPATSTDSSLTGISCPAVTSCTAVGFATVAGVSVPLAERWNGETWTLSSLPKPAAFSHGLLSTVSCSSANACTAVGEYDNTKGTQLMLAYRWNGSAWAVQPVPAPSNFYGQSLVGVACPAAATCFAVGSYFQSSGNQLTIAERWNGTTWATQATPKGYPKYLVTISCTSATACTAAGSYGRSNGDVPLVERWNGSAWTAETAPNPASSAGTYPAGIACPTAASCTLVGDDQGSTAFHALAEGWNGRAWALETAPKPPAGDGAFLAGVSCTTATACTAVGYAQNNTSGSTSPLGAAWNGKAWTAETPAAPAGASAASLFGVACPAAGACEAVGTYQTGTTFGVLAEAWNGKSWVVQPAPAG